MKDIILSAYFGGLGDNLQFSTLPELYSKKGYNVYIWSESYFRNQGIYDFVWATNPYIKGKKSGNWNAGDTPDIQLKKTGSFIKDWEKAHDFERINDYPKIYYRPKNIKGFENCILVDVTTISTVYDADAIKKIILDLKKEYKDKLFLLIKFKTNLNPPTNARIAHNGNVYYFDAYHDGEVLIESLFHYYDLMYSSYGLISLHTGASHLSTCIKILKNNFESICLITEWTKKREIFFFPNMRYIII